MSSSSSSSKHNTMLLIVIVFSLIICILGKPLNGNYGEEVFIVKDFEDQSGEYVKYEVFKEEDENKPKNCVGVVTLMALCF